MSLCVSLERSLGFFGFLLSLPMASIATVKPGKMTTLDRLVEQQKQEMQWQEMQWQTSYGQQIQQADAAAGRAAASSWQEEHWSELQQEERWSEWQQMDSSIGSQSSFTAKSKINKDVSLGNLKNEWPKSLKT